MATFIGSSGTLVGAALESAGMFYQSYLLDVFGPALSSSLGALAYMIGAMVCVGAFLVSGQPKYAIWMLVGPGLFYSVICFRSPTEGAEWIFGGEARNNQQVSNVVSSLIESDIDNPRVSSIFAQYNRVVSSIIRQVVKTLMSGKDALETDKKFIIRSQLFSIIATPQFEAPGFYQLLHLAMITKCSRYLTLGQQLVDIETPERRLCGYEGQKSIVEDYELAAQEAYQLSQEARNYVAALVRADNSLMTEINVTRVEPSCVADAVRYRCSVGGVWNDSATEAALRYRACYNGDVGHARDYVQRVCERSAQARQSGRKLATSPEVLAEANRQTGDAELETRINAFVAGNFTCHSIWNLVYAGLQQEAMNTLSRGLGKLEDLNVTKIEEYDRLCSGDVIPSGILSEFVPFSGNDDPRDIVRFLAKNLLRSEMHQSSASAVAAGVAQNGEIFQFIGTPTENRVAADERLASQRREWEHRSDVMVGAARLPYIQGLLLYWLGLVFPFFALLLLVPGKHIGFFLWFALWAWVKSWDIGYAVVYLLDDVLYSIFVVQATGNPDAPMHVLSADPALAIQAMREVDPTFQVGTYYNIIGTALLAIPAVMSYIFISGINGGVGLVTQGIKREITGGSGGTTGFANFGGLSDMARKSWAAPGYQKMRREVADQQGIAAQSAIQNQDSGKSASTNTGVANYTSNNGEWTKGENKWGSYGATAVGNLAKSLPTDNLGIGGGTNGGSPAPRSAVARAVNPGGKVKAFGAASLAFSKNLTDNRRKQQDQDTKDAESSTYNQSSRYHEVRSAYEAIPIPGTEDPQIREAAVRRVVSDANELKNWAQVLRVLGSKSKD